MRDEHFLLQYDAQDTPRPSWHSSIKLIFENPSRKRRRGIKSLTGHFVDNNTALVEVQVRTASSDSHVVRFVVLRPKHHPLDMATLP